MKVLERPENVTRLVESYRRAELSVGFVPTLGGLHAGHLGLVQAAREECERVVLSIYLNPTQFDSPADLDAYPASLDDDLARCREACVDVVYLGAREDLLPQGFSTWVEVEGLTKRLCGASRPGHFRGVTTIVTQLLHVVQPHRVYFGLKDFQQARVIEKMVRDLRFPTEIRSVPTVRAKDGLALSSRNDRLTIDERKVAPHLFRSLEESRVRIEGGVSDSREIARDLKLRIEEETLFRVDYAEVLTAWLGEFSGARIDRSQGVLIAVAAYLGSARLIDNIYLPPTEREGMG